MKALLADVAVIGAGPAGSAAATILAGHGHRVIVLERAKFPRYHIGESLLPFCFEPLNRLGLIERLRRSPFVKKFSVQFVSPDGRVSQPFYFGTRYPEHIAQTWQVLRSEFDQLLADNAREHGATVLEEVEVKDFIRDPDGAVTGVVAESPAGESLTLHARMTIDCSGRDAVAAAKNRWRIRDPWLNKVAVWTYYKGAIRDEGIDAGATTAAFIPNKGWFWYIPLHDDLTSVGVVADGKYLSRDGVRDPLAMFEREIRENRWIEARLAPAARVDGVRITYEYSFHVRHCASAGLLLAGDAFCFLDPIFSSGLMFALKSGVMAADAIHAGLCDGDLRPERFGEYAERLRAGIENFRRLIYAFYDPDFSFKEIVHASPHLADLITDCLSGDVDRDFSELFDAIAERVALPDPVPCGAPLVEDGAASEAVRRG